MEKPDILRAICQAGEEDKKIFFIKGSEEDVWKEHPFSNRPFQVVLERRPQRAQQKLQVMGSQVSHFFTYLYNATATCYALQANLMRVRETARTLQKFIYPDKSAKFDAKKCESSPDNLLR